MEKTVDGDHRTTKNNVTLGIEFVSLSPWKWLV